MLGKLRSSSLVCVLFLVSACGFAEEQPSIERSQLPLGYADSTWNPADPSNYTRGNRGVGDITEVVVHTMEGYYGGSQSWFQNPSANVSAHYLLRSDDGEITQMVDDSDYAWHVFCLNETAIGIEHEGFVGEGSTWYTDAMYQESAKLTAWLVNQYLIPLDRTHILGHDETGCTDHGDPGVMWDWDKYMQLVEQYAVRTRAATLVSLEAPEQMAGGDYENVRVTLRNDGNYTWAQETVLLGTQSPQDHVSEFSSNFWVSGNRAAGPATTDNYAGEEIVFVFPILAPSLPETTTITETLQLTDEEGNWFGPELSFSVEILRDSTLPEPMMGEESGCGCTTSGKGSGAWSLLLLLALLPWRRRR